MKKILFLLVVVLLAACNSANEPGPVGPEPEVPGTLTVVELYDVAFDATSVALKITGTSGLQCKLTKESGDLDGSTPEPFTCNGAEQSVAITFSANGTNEVRQAKYKLEVTNSGDASLNKTLTISQAAKPGALGALVQSPENNIAAEGATVEITAPDATVDWVGSIAEVEGFTLEADTKSVIVSVNPTKSVRSAEFTATAEGVDTPSKITIRQAAATLSVAELQEVAHSATSVNVKITGTKGLTCTLTKESGTLDGSTPEAFECDGTEQSVTFTFSANPTAAAREAVYRLTVTNEGADGTFYQTVTIKQAAAVLAVADLQEVAFDATTVDLKIRGTNGLTCTLTKESGTLDGSTPEAFTCGGAEQSVAITFTANPTYAARQATYTLAVTNEGADGSLNKTITITQAAKPAPEGSVAVDGVCWAVGNLVADGSGGCKIGNPEDGGLYFQFGSLIGWKGGQSGNGVGKCAQAAGKLWGGASSFNYAKEKMVSPSEMSTSPEAWQNNNYPHISTLNNYYFNYSVAPYATAGQDIRGFDVSIDGDAGEGDLASGRYAKLGVGDPCTYYLGAEWRLPTNSQYQALYTAGWSGSGFKTKNGSLGHYFGAKASEKDPTTSVFFPASGLRHPSDGSFYNVSTCGFYWTGSVNDAQSGYNLLFSSGEVEPQRSYYRSDGFPVRCVLAN